MSRGSDEEHIVRPQEETMAWRVRWVCGGDEEVEAEAEEEYGPRTVKKVRDLKHRRRRSEKNTRRPTCPSGVGAGIACEDAGSRPRTTAARRRPRCARCTWTTAS